MKNPWLFGSLATLVTAASAHAGTTMFVSSLTGANERPDPVSTPARGTASAVLTGEPGRYILDWTITYSNLSSDPVAGHIHYSIAPPGREPTEVSGPIVEELDDFPDEQGHGRSATITGDWTSHDRTKPLTDELVDSLFDGELYLNIHSENFPNGEIRGQLVRAGDPTLIPLPAPVLSGVLGLGAAGLTALRFNRSRRRG